MSIDREVLNRYLRFEDRQAGLSEEFVQAVIGHGRTIGVLSRPLGDPLSVGWVLCHSFGIEQVHLGRLDVITARALSRAGFPVLRFHGQGYGDAERGMEVAGLSSHVAEAVDAVEMLKRLAGVEAVGVMGARFGGAIAALTADRLQLPLLALWDPMVKGAQFIREFLRSQVLADIVETGEGGGASDLQSIQEHLSTEGWADIKGWPLTRAAHDDIVAVDLVKDVQQFRGSALLVALSRTGTVTSAASSLSSHLRALGAATSLQVIQDGFAPQFGQFRWRTVDGGKSKRDTQLELNEKIAEATVGWALSLIERSPAPIEAPR